MNWWSYSRKSSANQRRQQVIREARRAAKEGRELSPVVIDGRTIAHSFWGKSWCENLESYRDYESRLPRGRTYVRSGAVLDLQISSGKIKALVCGSEIYRVTITTGHLKPDHWGRIKTQCAGNIGSVIELLEGRLSERVMQVVTHRGDGLFPKPAEIEMECSCPDWATMCKHVAAVLYSVGARLDQQPELLFVLRNADHTELIAQAVELASTRKASSRKVLADDVLGDVFGIEIGADVGIDSGSALSKEPSASGKVRRRKAKTAKARKRVDLTGGKSRP